MTVSLPAEVIAWIDSQVETLKYANRSHAIEVALDKLKKGDRPS
jgi:Arc/MetJ-type ribon-helix-helix transcriptional regulator